MLRLEPAARAEVLECHQQLSEIAGSTCGQGVFKVAARKSQGIFISLPSLSMSNPQAITSLLQKTLMHPRFDRCIVLISKRSTMVVEKQKEERLK